MEIDSAPESASLSPRDRILERLAVIGVPEEHRRKLYSGLVEFITASRSRIPKVVSAILPTSEEVAEALQKSKERSRKSRASPSMKKRFRESMVWFRESMVWLQWLMFENDPGAALENLAKSNVAQRGVCGAVWGNDDIAYRCRTCENDSTCAICVPCFQNGNHKDHDYSIISTGIGCCDCGDETAWKRDGFCSKHKGAELMEPLPEELANSVGPVLDALFCTWKNTLLSAEDTSRRESQSGKNGIEYEKSANELTFVVVEMLLEFCKYSESLLGFVSKRIISSVSLLKTLVRAERYLSKDVLKNLHELLLKFLGEPIFKSEFANLFVDYYPVVINEAVKLCSDNALNKYPLLSTFSVQIFTVPTLTPYLVKEKNLLAVLLGCLGGIFISCAGEDGRLQDTKWERLCDTTNHVMGDMKFVLNHIAASKYATCEERDISRTWLRLLTFVQGMNPLKRETGVHIEEENRSMHLFFLLDYFIAVNNSLMVDGAYSAANGEETYYECISKENLDMDDQDGERHAKIGRLSSEGSACSVMGSSTPSAGILKVAEGNHGDSCDALLPSSAVLLIHECLGVLESCLGPDEGISKVLQNVSSSNSGSISSGNILELKRRLLDIEKEKYIYVFNRLANSNRDPCIGFSHAFGDAQMSINMEDAGATGGEIQITVSDETCCSSADLIESSSRGDFAFESDAVRVLSLAEWPDISYDVSSQDISVHISLHRLLSLLIQKALTRCYGDSLMQSSANAGSKRPYTDFFQYVLGDCHPYGFSAFIMEHVLRIRVFCAEVKAGMWRKNGDAAFLACEWYRTSRWSEQGLELDLFLLQCCGALAPADRYVNRILDRFGLSGYLSLTLERSNEYEPALVQEMLTLIIQILQERRFCGLSMAESLRREMIYKLAIGDVTHSQLVKSLPCDLSKFDRLQEILDSVAVYYNPSGLNQGKYSLRSSCWRELDLYHPHWNSRDLQTAEERYLRYCGMSALTTQLPKWTRIYAPLEALAKIATCKATLQIISAVLYYALNSDKSVESRAPDGVLITALHLLSLSLDICIQQKQSSCQGCYTEDSFPIIALAGQEIFLSIQAVGKQSLLSLLVSLMRTRKEDNLHCIAEVGGCNLSLWIGSLLRKFAEIDFVCLNKLQNIAPEVVSHFSDPDTTMSDSASDNEKRKVLARKRQAAILEKMKAQQSKFLSSVCCSVDEAGSKAETETNNSYVERDSQVHEVCSLCHDTNSEEPVAFLVFLQKSKILSLVDRGPPSWDQTDQSVKEKVSIVIDRAPNLLEMNISDSLRVSSPQLLQLVDAAINESSNNRQQREPNSILEVVKARLTRNCEVQNNSNDESTNSEHCYETLEQDMYLQVRKKCDDLNCKSFTWKEHEQPNAESGPNRILGGDQSDWHGKYVEILSRENSRKPPASASFHNGNFLAESLSQSGYDGCHPFGCDGIHLSSCGHAVHQGCLDRYLSSLRERAQGGSTRRNVFEGAHIVDPDEGEFLCPVCRRLANSVLPAAPTDSQNTWQLPVASDINTAVVAGEDKSNVQIYSLRLSEALCLLQSAADVIAKGDILKAFPFPSDDQRRDLESVSRTLSKMYFSKRRTLDETFWASRSIMLWDTLKYSLMSMEINARCGKASLLPIYSIDSLYKEFKTSSGSILSLLLGVLQSTRTKNSVHVLQRFRGIQLFAESICSGNSVGYPSSIHGTKGRMLGLLKNLRPEPWYAVTQFWNRASDPVLAQDPFSSLMWVLFCLPFPFVSCKESLLYLVHIFYVVSLVQAVITYFAQHQNHFEELSFRDCLIADISKVLRESKCVQQYFTSNYIDTSCNIKDTLRKLSFPFLRRCLLLWRLLNSGPGPSHERDSLLDTPSLYSGDMMDFVDADPSDLGEIQKLEKMFKIPPIDAILSDKLLRSLALQWFQHFRREYEGNRVQGIFYVTPTVPFRLINLPHLYQNVLQRCIKQCCPDCKRVIEEPALCLMCGRLCSPSWKLCCSESGCQAHAMSCGAGVGVFLLIRRTTILLQRCLRQASWQSPYLDAFGEEDIEMYRGKPLYLNKERYAALSYMVASHGLDQSTKVLAQTTIESFFIA